MLKNDLGLDGPAGVELKLIAADNDEVPGRLELGG